MHKLSHLPLVFPFPSPSCVYNRLLLLVECVPRVRGVRGRCLFQQVTSSTTFYFPRPLSYAYHMLKVSCVCLSLRCSIPFLLAASNPFLSSPRLSLLPSLPRPILLHHLLPVSRASPLQLHRSKSPDSTRFIAALPCLRTGDQPTPSKVDRPLGFSPRRGARTATARCLTCLELSCLLCSILPSERCAIRSIPVPTIVRVARHLLSSLICVEGVKLGVCKAARAPRMRLQPCCTITQGHSITSFSTSSQLI